MNALFRLLILTSLSLLALAPPAGAAPVQRDHVEAELIAEHRTLQAGRSDNTVALRLKPEAGWHVYWRNPGDSGLPTRLEWRLPEGVQAGEIAWPYPHAQSLGDLTNYGYDAETLHLVPLSVDRGLAETTVTLEVTAKWLVCADVCIPGEADLQLTLPVIAEAPAPDARWTDAFRQARSQLPRRDEALKARFQVGEGEFRLAVEGLPAEATAARFFPYSGELIQHSAYARQMLEAPAGRLRIAVAQSPYLVDPPALVEGVLLLTLGSGEGVGSRQAQAYEIRAEPGEVAAVAGLDPPPVRAAESPAAPAEAPPGWALVLGFAFLGGLILNLMPCVFPVLALKAYTVLQAREEERGAQRAHALAYTAGVLASFALIGGLLIALRAGGAALGWGFQLQSPVVVTALAWLMVMLGLSMSGAFELGTRWMGLGQGLAAQGGSRGAFFTGVLATVVASPCTAPFMGTALGFALTQPAALALLVFLTLGLGLAMPFLLLGFVPRLAQALPRPGAWMETFKQLMAYPLYLTAVWLLWVLARQAGADALGLALIGLVLLAFASWRAGQGQGWGWRLPRYLALGLALAVLAHPLLRAGAPAAPHPVAGWEPYSDARLAELRAEGRTVLVDFTADWCITCKVNEKVVLDNPEVKAALARAGVALLVGDWTRYDPAITAVLTRYGRSGVPLYLLSKQGAEPIVLPQVLTPGLLIDAVGGS